MTNQERLNALLEKAAQNYQKLNAKQQEYAIKEISRTRLELNDLLTDYAKKDNTIAKNRLNSLLRDLETLEQSIRDSGMDAMESVIKESSLFGIETSDASLITSLGATAATGVSLNRLNNESFRYVVNRFGDDGLVLSDRVWQLAGDQREELNRVIRSGIIRGESVNTLVGQVRQVYDNETWKIRRLVVTEGNTAYRTGTTYVAQRNDFVKGIRIHRGRADRPEHKCTVLSRQNAHGLGTGVYPPDNTEIINPHPNCTSWLEYVLD